MGKAMIITGDIKYIEEKVNGYSITYKVTENTLIGVNIGRNGYDTDGEINELKIPERAEICNIFSFTPLYTSSDIKCPFVKKLVLPDTVVSVEECAFKNTNIFREITWSKNCKKIPNECFYGSSIEQIHGIENVSYIGEMAFAMSKLKSIKYPASCKTIKSNCFTMSNLEKILGIDDVEEIMPGAFDGTCIKSFILPKKVKSIPNRCFRNCEDLREISPLIDISSIGDQAFSGCFCLKNINIISSYCINLASTAFENMGCSGCCVDLSQCYINVDYGDFVIAPNEIIVHDWITRCRKNGIILPYYFLEEIGYKNE